MSPHPIQPDADTSERLGEDDLATRREEEHRAIAMAEQARRSRQAVQHGICQSCGAELLSGLVYCDADCRADHERELAVRRRQGRG